MLNPDFNPTKNTVDPDQLASEKPAYQDPHCFPLSLYSKTCVKLSLSKRLKIGFQDRLSLNSAILSTFIKLPFVIKIFVLSIIEWLFYTCFTVYAENWNLAS